MTRAFGGSPEGLPQNEASAGGGVRGGLRGAWSARDLRVWGAGCIRKRVPRGQRVPGEDLEGGPRRRRGGSGGGSWAVLSGP